MTPTPIADGDPTEHGIHFPEPSPGHLGFEVEDTEEHPSGLALANDVQVIRHPDGMVSLMIDGQDFPWFFARTPAMQYVEATDEHPFPVLLIPLICQTISVTDAPAAAEGPAGDESCCDDNTCPDCYETALADALEGIVVHHPEGDAAP